MREAVILIYIFVVCSISLESREHQRYWIFFTDKNGVREPIDTIERIFYGNDPVSERYVEAIYSITDSITIRSRWLNAVSVPATAEQLERLFDLPFVKSTQPVGRMARPQPVPDTRDAGMLHYGQYPLENYYGHSERQIKMHGIDVLHNTGITGSGVLIGFLDTGYRWDQHVALKDASVIAERDFVAEHYHIDNLPGGHYSHGTLVFSVVAGFDPGTFVGVAHDAEFLLGATEDERSETPIEEDFWVAAIEWMEEMGVDIVSTSLGYSTFDAPHQSYSTDDMDGETAVTTIAADRAFERGILFVASAGNEGNSDWRIITSPADGKYVIATGALDSFANTAGFSSRGPSADGRIKPDISAMGVSVAGAQAGIDGYRFASGTSLAAPLVSGTAGLLLSARPDLTARELRHSLLMSARREGNPDNEKGYGILDAPSALAYPVKRITPGSSTAIESFLTARDGIVEETVTLHLQTMSDPEYIMHPFTLAEQSIRKRPDCTNTS
jgi:serine protease AprX